MDGHKFDGKVPKSQSHRTAQSNSERTLSGNLKNLKAASQSHRTAQGNSEGKRLGLRRQQAEQVAIPPYCVSFPRTGHQLTLLLESQSHCTAQGYSKFIRDLAHKVMPSRSQSHRTAQGIPSVPRH